ncbi:hypothetical protein [Burkholderia multivorans]|uniref:hypothetical protein n=1 Tax=Burkholderia multivorans TaxID=87883 RepID=UPI001FC836F8|nr:hypothetical protein [Burkholderia multivorans]MCA8463763.1 hypothetical protein [Burkholderia multivorans]MDN8018373.1 hypothetical protein [Burkholderia multivorans]MDN8057687.1 hypothetical protein [Burkholderia multivorans]
MRAAEGSIERSELLTIAYQSPLNPLYPYSKFTRRATIFGDFHYAPSGSAIVVDSSIDSLMNRIALMGAIMLFARATIVVCGSRDDAIVHRARVDCGCMSSSRMSLSESDA